MTSTALFIAIIALVLLVSWPGNATGERPQTQWGGVGDVEQLCEMNTCSYPDTQGQGSRPEVRRFTVHQEPLHRYHMLPDEMHLLLLVLGASAAVSLMLAFSISCLVLCGNRGARHKPGSVPQIRAAREGAQGLQEPGGSGTQQGVGTANAETGGASRTSSAVARGVEALGSSIQQGLQGVGTVNAGRPAGGASDDRYVGSLAHSLRAGHEARLQSARWMAAAMVISALICVLPAPVRRNGGGGRRA